MNAPSATPTAWAAGIAARIGALASTGDDADRLYRESIDRLGDTRLKAELAAGTCSTANGCDAKAAGSKRANSS